MTHFTLSTNVCVCVGVRWNVGYPDSHSRATVFMKCDESPLCVFHITGRRERQTTTAERNDSGTCMGVCGGEGGNL